MPECKHGLEEATCSTCRTVDARTLLRQGRFPAGWVAVEASFDSRCPGCGGFVQLGEAIYKTHPDETFVCESCAVHELRRALR